MRPADEAIGDHGDEGAAPGPDAPEYGSRTIGDLHGLIKALDQAWHPGAADDPPTRLDRIGPYRDLERVGRGGMGAVYRAVDSRTDEVVAVKIPASRLMADESLHGRFLREADAANLLDHPGIVRFRELGEDGSFPYIVSDFCDGPNLSTWIRAQAEPATARGAARLVALLADAVAHAHDRGVLHRDLKPSNVMLPGAVFETDVEKLTPRITDFGLAKLEEDGARGDDQATRLLLTQTGDLIGSPAYMAPEQATGKAAAIGRCTDVYGLGTILYGLLTGRPPFRGETVAETLRLVREADPVPPRELRPGLSRDLDRIALRCLEKAPADRYETVSALADDLRRFLDGRPIDSRTGSMRRRIARWARRRPKLARSLAAGGLAAVLVVGAGVGWNLSLRRLNEQVTGHRRLTDRLNYTLQLQLAQRAYDQGQLGRSQLLLRDLAPAAGDPDHREFAWRYLWRLTRREARLLGEMEADVFGNHAFSGDGGLLALTDGEGGLGLFDVHRGERIWYSRRKQSGHGEQVALSSDGRTLASVFEEDRPDGARTSKPEIRELPGGKLAFPPPPVENRVIDRLVLTAQGRNLTVIDHRTGPSGSADYKVTTWELGDASRRTPRRRSEASLPLAAYVEFGIAPDGLSYAATTADDKPGVYDLHSKALRVGFADAPPGLTLNLARFSPDGRRVAVHDDKIRRLMIWDAASGKLLQQFAALTSPLVLVALQPGGEAVLTADAREEVRLVDPSRGLDLQILPPNPEPHIGKRFQLAFTPAGTDFLVCREPYMEADRIELRSTADGKVRAESPGRQMGRMADWTVLDASKGGPGLVYSQGRYVWCWRWDQAKKQDAAAALRHSDEAWALAYNRAGSVLATGSNDTHEDQTIKIWDARSHALLRAWKCHDATVTALSFAPDGVRLASSSLSSEQGVRVWDPATGRLLAAPEWPAEPARSVAFDGRGARLAAVGSKGTLRVWNAADLATIWTVSAHVDRIHAVAFSPDSARLATGGDDGFVRIWDAASGRPLGAFRASAEILAVEFDADGRRLAAASREGAIHLLDPATAQLVRVIRSDDREVRGLAFSPDGRTLASGGLGKSIRFWDPETGHELLSLEGLEAQINDLDFSPDGSALASADHSGAVRIWRADPVVPSRPSSPGAQP
ncbi:MAG: protein kinase [Paludisphaera borealis]|uniref:WD40 repeat domain-containing serine/threonine protein kinase n=1 Tax=Paludisphaera borealis TaxID=1387353 RepID=UPI002845095C|nr:protein kinase [Paludisphaera borealis]MDR3620167.1 protein kinase [Paludisphaera borealis]